MVINCEVEIRNNEPVDNLIKRFMKKIKKIRLMDEIKEHLVFIGKSEENHKRDQLKIFKNEKRKEEEEQERKK